MTNRWKIFAVLALLFIVGFFYRVSMAVVSRDLAADLGLSAAQLGVMSAIYFYAFAFSQIPLGPLIDRYGGRAIISILGVVTTCGSLTFAVAPNYLTALAGRGLLGLGTAAILMGSLKIFTNYFSHQEFPKVSGFMIAAGNMGSVFATAPLAFAIGLFTWRPIFLAMTIAQALATISVFLIVRDAPSGSGNRFAPSPERAGGAETGVLGVWKLLLGSPDFWLISLIAFFWYANYMVLLALWGGPYLMEGVGLGRSQAGTVLLYTSAGYICGSLLVGKAIDWLGGSLEKTILCGQSLLLAAMTAMLGPADHFPVPLLAAVFFAVGLVSASGVIIYPLARKLVPPHSAATAMTCVNFFLLMGAATMQHIMGYYIYSFPRTPAGYPAAAYHGAFLIPICGLACTLVLFSLRRVSNGFDSKTPITESASQYRA
jgi:predicted MFS family arabinose efflux permease